MPPDCADEIRRLIDAASDVPQFITPQVPDAPKLESPDAAEQRLIGGAAALSRATPTEAIGAAITELAAADLGPIAERRVLDQIKHQTGVPIRGLEAELRGAKVALRPAEEDSGSQADILVALANAADLYHAPDGAGFADVTVAGHRESWPIRSRGFRRWLIGEFYRGTGSAPNSEAVQAALNVIEAKAHYDGATRTVYVRVADFDGVIYLDLGDEQWRAIQITATGWRVASDPPVRFRRAPGIAALPQPVSGGSIDELRSLVNVQSERDWVLVIAWLLAALRGCGPFPVLVLTGEQGAGKSLVAKILRSLVDPHSVALRSPPRNDRDLFIAATNGYVIVLDNLSALQAWLSDALCRIATGGGFATRALYTDTEETVLVALRPTILNGIEDYVTRGDLADRSIALGLESIPEDRRRTEREILTALDEARPRILGALLDAVAHGLRQLPHVRLNRLPRMADFATWATACEGAFWPAGTFERAYAGARTDMDETVIEADAVALSVRSLAATQAWWSGTAKELQPLLAAEAGEAAARTKTWPQTPRALSGRLRRVVPALRRVGIRIEFPPRSAVKRLITIQATQETESCRFLPSRPSLPSPAEDSRRSPDDGTEPPTVIDRHATDMPTPQRSSRPDGRDGRDGSMHSLSGSPPSLAPGEIEL